ncbi:FMN-binding protein [Streptomyces sp. NBC_00820]|uniref:FMN-binding protein n=1 Tax=Streptomyces sp. NBC_00820 TaxID=2975842 RepID=UPI002ED25CC1|nr:FMN-binding protein [Streptomyces sp. NBC_00820]
MRRTLFTFAATAAGITTLLALKPHQPPAPAAAAGPTGGTSPLQGHGTTANPSGVYTGDTVDTPYGPVQVRITLRGGRLTGVTALRTPDGNPRDREIASYAVPRLTGEALDAQSARIDAVSGATYTSGGYVRSLQSALDKASG